MAQANTPQVSRIRLSPCTGFGGEGRNACLVNAAGDAIGSGAGATDDEAVAEALMDAGLSLGEAYDVVDTVIRAARIERA